MKKQGRKSAQERRLEETVSALLKGSQRSHEKITRQCFYNRTLHEDEQTMNWTLKGNYIDNTQLLIYLRIFPKSMCMDVQSPKQTAVITAGLEKMWRQWADSQGWVRRELGCSHTWRQGMHSPVALVATCKDQRRSNIEERAGGEWWQPKEIAHLKGGLVWAPLPCRPCHFFPLRVSGPQLGRRCFIVL